MAIRRKKEGEYHTGRLNISCSPTMKDRIAVDATAAGKSISQYMLDLYDQSVQADEASPEYMARMGLEMVGLKKRLVDIDNNLRRNLNRSKGVVDPVVADTVLQLREIENEIDGAVHDIVELVKKMKLEEK